MFFFFSSRRRHTRYWRDWSSDVCSSDLALAEAALVEGEDAVPGVEPPLEPGGVLGPGAAPAVAVHDERHLVVAVGAGGLRSGERRVGKEWRFRWSAYHLKKKYIMLVPSS